MAEQSSLVVTASDSVKPEDGIRVIDFATDATRAAQNGDWCEAGIDATAAALDTAAVIADPFGELLSSAFAWMMEHVSPLPEMLDQLAGNHDVIQANAATWANVSQHLNRAGEDMRRVVDTDTASWKGTAVDVYRTFGHGEANLIEGAAKSAEAVGAAVSGAGTAVLIVRTTVRDIIADAMSELVQYLIRSAAAAGLTLGLATPALVADGIRIVMKWANKVREWLSKIVRSFRRLSKIVDDVKHALKQVDDVLKPAVNTVKNAHGKFTRLPDEAQTLITNTGGVGATHDDQMYAKKVSDEQ